MLAWHLNWDLGLNWTALMKAITWLLHVKFSPVVRRSKSTTTSMVLVKCLNNFKFAALLMMRKLDTPELLPSHTKWWQKHLVTRIFIHPFRHECVVQHGHLKCLASNKVPIWNTRVAVLKKVNFYTLRGLLFNLKHIHKSQP